jgi:hypothetical protein
LVIANRTPASPRRFRARRNSTRKLPDRRDAVLAHPADPELLDATFDLRALTPWT